MTDITSSEKLHKDKLARQCSVCGENFLPVRAWQVFCSNLHYFNCLNCGKEFSAFKGGKKFCSSSCSTSYMNKTKFKEFVCQLCGKSFKAKGQNAKVCPDDHYLNCFVCKKDFIVSKKVSTTRLPKVCSPKCSAAFGKENRKETNLKKYGVETPFHSKEIQEKATESWILKYGKTAPEKEKLLEVQRKTNLERYGVESLSQLTEEKKKFVERMLDPKVQESIRKSNLKKYGVENQFQRDEIKEKIKNSNLEKYGVEYAGQIPEVKEKIKETNLKKYGVEHVSQNPEIMKKAIDSKIKKYGYASNFQDPKFWKDFKDRTGFDNPAQQNIKNFEEFSDLETWAKKFTEITGRKIITQDICDYFNISFSKAHEIRRIPQLQEFFEKKISGPEVQIFDFLTSLGLKENNDFILHDHSIISPKELDFYFPKSKFAIEVSPTATHSSEAIEMSFGSLPGKDRNYHMNKASMCHDVGVSLLTIFDWMPEDRVQSLIRSKLRLDSHKIGARKCELRSISQTIANRFLKEFHIMGGSRKQSHCYGLFYNDELIQVQTFGENSKWGWEAKRLATRDDWLIAGGISKITKRFIKEVNPKTIVAYADLNISWPDFDSRFNGFKLDGVIKPQKCWSKGSKMILDRSAAFQSADRLIGIADNSKNSIYPESWTNEQVFMAEGWYPVWDCGMIREVYYSN